MEETENKQQDNKKLIQSILVVVGAVVLISGISLLMDGQSASSPAPNTAPSETEQEEEINITMSVEGLIDSRQMEIPPGTTVLEAIRELDEEQETLELQTEDYGEMGTLVTSMGDMENGTNDEYWQYEVNGEMPMVGADAYELTEGDTVSWEFKSSEF